MRKFYDLDFNQFTVIEHKELPKLEVRRGHDIFDGGFGGSINIQWSDENRSMWSLKSTDNEDDMDWFESIVDEFNEDSTQEEWTKYYNECKKEVIKGYKESIARDQEKLSALLGE